jgi:Yip1-like protein
VLQTVPEPRKIAREVQALTFPRRVLWQALGLLLVAATFLGVISSILFPVDAETFGTLVADPIMTGIAQGSISVLTVFAIYWIGRALGGAGSFDQALLTVIWLQFVLLIIELGVLFLGVFAPGLALLLWVMGMVMTFWILSHFIAEMHGFRSAGAVFGGIFMVLIAVAVVMSIVFSMIGLGVPGEPGMVTAPGPGES